jgi:hypothetical protein
LALEKATNLVGERLKMLFRIEAFNIFNHTQFANPRQHTGELSEPWSGFNDVRSENTSAGIALYFLSQPTFRMASKLAQGQIHLRGGAVHVQVV